MADANQKIDATKRKLAEIALDALLYQMGVKNNAAQWWFQGAEVAQDRDGRYFLLAKISPKLPLDETTGWPYGLPHDSNGVPVRSSRENLGWHAPTSAFPTNP